MGPHQPIGAAITGEERAAWLSALSAELACRYRAQMGKELRLANRFLKDRRAHQSQRSRRFN
jgi:hypothetical protein